MPRIHPTAIVDPQAELADDVEIGPWCLIQGPVKVGPRCQLQERVSLQAPLALGAGNILHANVCIGRVPQDRKFDSVKGTGGVVIGQDNQIREGVTIHRATGSSPTRIGDRNMLMANSHAAHDVVIGNDCTLANGVLLAGHVTIEDRAILGGNAAVHQFCRVGRLSMISGGAVITKDLPPFCTVYSSRRIGSLNLVGLRRAGYREHIRPLRDAFDIYFRSHHAGPQALALITERLGHDPLCAELVAFIRASVRGIILYGRAAEDSRDE